MMQKLPREALVITKNDETTFTIWYFHFGLKQRKDISIIVEGLLQYDWYQETLRYTYPELNLTSSDTITVETVIAENPFRRYCIIESPQDKISCDKDSSLN